MSWPAKVFHHEFAAHIWTRVATVAAQSCAKDLVAISWTKPYTELPDAGKREVDRSLLSPFETLDPNCPLPPNQWHEIVYEVRRVALHD